MSVSHRKRVAHTPTATTTTEAACRFTIGLKAPTRLHDEPNLDVVCEGANMRQFFRGQSGEIISPLRSRRAMVVRQADMSVVHGGLSKDGIASTFLDVSKIL